MADCANPLLLGWVKEWLDQARERNSKGASVYKKAYDSLKSCPLPFDHPSEAQQLHGFGPKLCDRLTTKLKEHCEREGLPMPGLPHRKRKKSTSKDNEDDDDDGAPSPPKKARKQKAYVPTLRSGAYALVVALSTLDEGNTGGLTKPELIELAQPLCDSSFTAASQANKFYTAWNSMKTLESKELVYTQGRPSKRYSLSEEGWEVAKRIKKTLMPNQDQADDSAGVSPKGQNKETNNFVDPRPSSPRSRPQVGASPTNSTATDLIPQGISSELPAFSPIILPPGSFKVELVLDTREVRAKSDRDYIQIELAKKGVTPIMRALALGDILWVAKLHNPELLSSLGADGDEVLLDWIVERKRLDDLVSSIKDSRYDEQKFRLLKSGVKNVVYMIEEFAMNAEHFHKYEEMVESAIASTQVVNGFFIKKTQKMDDSIRYLARMTMLLKSLYENKPLQVIPSKVITTKNYLPLLTHLREKEPDLDYNITYGAFASLASKSDSLTLRDVYLKMLMCTRGVTGEKALEIQKRWKTPAEFAEAYKKCGLDDEGRKKKLELVSGQMQNLVGRKKVGKAGSVKIAEVWGDEVYA
ncbi:Crossover junction endonuclease MUS81 [Hyphodiscus hymeniophilus]|uniref:Crossover junction endonuclease MUS81 n=1 Tax=Hyphodiscus hymeniophilus TaxID=353542 RepID=A0A9P6VK40_9HELO|nr:Crossover junction endonuclease MUS81 [Hyphodiscus hymeniophilus]